uniref:Uncharacterized protein n=1 Tax=Candidozyma auris TaxID=498019 RepID=A0A0L0P2Q8_CANAR
MGKQYILTVTASHAHQLDILGVAMTDKYTVTVSSDGYAAFWDNKKDEVHNPSEHVVRKLIDPIGIHHVAAYQNIPPDLTNKVVLLAFACFDGSIRFRYYVNDDLETFTELPTGSTFKANFWTPGFYKDPKSKQDMFIATKASGLAAVYALNVKDEDGKIQIVISLLLGELHITVNNASFPNSLGVSKGPEGLVAVGYTSGDVAVFSLHGLKALFTFYSTDLQIAENIGSSSVPRVLEFSPGGSLLAVARDNQSAGLITLYDVEYGESVGSLTTSSHSAKTTVGGFAHEGWIMGLDFNEDGLLLASCGFDKCIRVWNIESREREATIQVNVTDLENTEHDESIDSSVCSGVAFINRGIRAGAGGDSNEGLCVVSFDRGVRWYREAGGI